MTTSNERKVFISHASEDKEIIARPLANALSTGGVDVWLDEYEIGWGDSLFDKINDGLSKSSIGIVIFSPFFLEKYWTNTELRLIFSLFVYQKLLLLPLLHNISRDQVVSKLPLFLDIVFEDSKTNLDLLVKKVKDKLIDVSNNKNTLLNNEVLKIHEKTEIKEFSSSLSNDLVSSIIEGENPEIKLVGINKLIFYSKKYSIWTEAGTWKIIDFLIYNSISRYVSESLEIIQNILQLLQTVTSIKDTITNIIRTSYYTKLLDLVYNSTDNIHLTRTISILKLLLDKTEVFDITVEALKHTVTGIESNEKYHQHVTSIMNVLDNCSDESIDKICKQLETIIKTHSSNLVRKRAALIHNKFFSKLNDDTSGTLTLEKRFRFKTIEYLDFVKDYIYHKNPLESKSLSEYYVKNDAILLDTKYWDVEESQIKESDKHEWTLEEFLNSNDWYTVLASSYGTGKSAFSKYTVSKFAENLLDSFDTEGNISPNEYFPIYCPLSQNFYNVWRQESLDQILKIATNNGSDVSRKILCIFDGLDEYPNKVSDFYKSITAYHSKYENMKIIITTRMDEEYLEGLYIDRNDGKFVRLFHFRKIQIKQFFDKYGISRHHNLISQLIGIDVLTNPLFCWMVGFTLNHNQKITPFVENRPNLLTKSLVYSNFVHSLIHARDKDTVNNKLKKLYITEKSLLRKIGALTQIHGNKLTKSFISKYITNFESFSNLTSDKLEELIDFLNALLSSYFHTINDVREEKIAFIHKSIGEYLISEYYLESILMNKPHRLSIGLPSKTTISFLSDLLLMIRASDKYEKPIETILKSFEKVYSVGDLYRLIYENSLQIVNQDRLYSLKPITSMNKSQDRDLELWFDESSQSYYMNHIIIHRWIGLYCLNKVTSFIDPFDRLIPIPQQDTSEEYFESLQKRMEDTKRITFQDRLSGFVSMTSNFIPHYLKYFKNFDMSGSQFTATYFFSSHLNNANLQNVNFSYSNLATSILNNSNVTGSHFVKANLARALLIQTNLTGANFLDADFRFAMMNCSIILNANFRLANLYGAQLSGSFLAYSIFYESVLSNCKLDHCYLNHTDFRSSDMSNVDLTNSNLESANLMGANMENSKLIGDNVR